MSAAGWRVLGGCWSTAARRWSDRLSTAWSDSPGDWCSKGPQLEPPLAGQGEAPAGRRRRRACSTRWRCPPLSIVEQSIVDGLKAKDARGCGPRGAGAREARHREDQEAGAARPDLTEKAARQTVERQCEGVLLPDVVLAFDDEELAGCTVGDILADPERV